MSDSTPGAEGDLSPLDLGAGSPSGDAILTQIGRIMPPSLGAVMVRAMDIARSQGRGLWVVGGVVRDAILGRESADLDLMVEPLTHETLPGEDPFLEALVKATGGDIRTHDAFRTAVLTLPEGEHVDVAQAREERYTAPGALPEVRPGRVADDLKRRDFSINAMALRLVGEGAPALEDPEGGLKDLGDGVLRVLHPTSFVDDPTRLYRGARFLARLGYRWHEEAESLGRAAFQAGLPDVLSPQRTGHELGMMAREPQFLQALEALEALGGLGSLGPVSLGSRLSETFDGLMDPLPDELMAGATAPSLGEVRLQALLGTGAPGDWSGILDHWGILGARGRAWASDCHNALALGEALGVGAPPSVIVPLLKGLSGVGRHRLWAACPGFRGQLREVLPHLSRRLPLTGRDLIQEGWTPGPTLGNVLRALECAFLDGAFDTRGEALAYARGLEMNGDSE